MSQQDTAGIIVTLDRAQKNKIKRGQFMTVNFGIVLQLRRMAMITYYIHPSKGIPSHCYAPSTYTLISTRYTPKNVILRSKSLGSYHSCFVSDLLVGGISKWYEIDYENHDPMTLLKLLNKDEYLKCLWSSRHSYYTYECYQLPPK